MEINAVNKPHLIFKMDDTGFPFNIVPPKNVATKGIRDVIKICYYVLSIIIPTPEKKMSAKI